MSDIRIKYKWKPYSRVGVPAQTVGERLDYLRKKYKRLTPQIIVSDAKPKDSVLHKAFEWNNNKAADLYRVDQARYMMRSIVICTLPTGEKCKPTKMWISIRSEKDKNKREDIHIYDAMSNPKLRRIVLKQALDELQQWKRRYEDYVELAEIFQAIATTHRKIAA